MPVDIVIAATGGFTEFLTEKFSAIEGLTKTGSGVAAMAVVAFAYIKMRTIKAVITAAILAGIAVWVISNISWIQERVDGETSTESSIERVAELPPGL